MPYNTTIEADAYFAARFGYDKWEPLDEPTKLQALTSAQQQLDLLCVWNGEKTDPLQDYEFPRDGDTEVPQDIKDSECEIAYSMVDANSTSTDAGDPLTALTAGSVNLQFKVYGKAGNPLVNDLTQTLLNPYGECDFNMGGGSTTKIPIYRG